MTARQPAVSILLQTRNHEHYIDQCLDSLSRQTLGDFEVVIVDDASTDRTTDRVREWLARAPVPAGLIVNEENLGICRSRNLGLRRCRGAFVAGLSGDDYYEPRRLEWQLEFFRTLGDSVAAVFSRARVVDAEDRERRVWFDDSERPPDGRVFERLLRGNFLPTPTVMVRRSALDAVGDYDEALFHEDYDMWLRLADRYEFRYLPRIVTNYRVLPTSASRNPFYQARLYESAARSLLKWVGQDRATDGVALRGARRYALASFGADPQVGLEVLRAVNHARPSPLNRAAVAAAELPGARWLASRALALRRGGRRI